MCSSDLTTTLSESFENGIPASWKTIDADGDGHGWKPGNAPGIAGYNSNGCVYSESFGLGGIGVLTPDNYLITPALDLPNGGKLTFWVCAQDANYASEHYAVYASSTGNDASNFTNALLEETITAKGVRSPEAIRGRIQGTWRQKTLKFYARFTDVVVLARELNLEQVRTIYDAIGSLIGRASCRERV